jgi:hypothetical protein
MRDYKDDVIEQLADENAALRARVEDLGSERDVVMQIAQAAIHYCNALNVRLDAIGERHERLHDAYRHLRERIMTSGDVAA